MLQAEHQLLSFGISWFDKWNSDSSGETPNNAAPSCYFEISDVPVGTGHVHQARYFSGSVHSQPQDLEKNLEPGAALVFLHGFGAGVGIYYAALPPLRAAWSGPVFALDWFGCSLSSRPEWTLGHGQQADPSEIERFFIDPLEQWRIATGIERMIIVGHSLGGYLGGCYATRFPQRVENLILASPAGVTGKMDVPSTHPPSLKLNLMNWMWNDAGINPLIGIWRLSTLVGRGPLRVWFRQFDEASWLKREKLVEYHYQSTLHGPISGGHCLTGLLDAPFSARCPLSERLIGFKAFAFIYGSRDSHHQNAKLGLRSLREKMGDEPKVLRVAGSGHDVMLDNPLGFVEAILTYLSGQSGTNKTFGEAPLAREASTRKGLHSRL